MNGMRRHVEREKIPNGINFKYITILLSNFVIKSTMINPAQITITPKNKYFAMLTKYSLSLFSLIVYPPE